MTSKRDSFKHADTRFVLMGAKEVGKSAVAVRFATKRFIGEYDSSQDFTYQYQATIDYETVNIEILDPGPVASGEAGERMLESRVAWGDAFILIYSITSRQSFNAILNYYQSLTSVKVKPVMILLANKRDMEHKRKVLTTEGRQLAEDFKCPFFECSASEAFEPIIEAFNELYREGVRKKRDRKFSLSPRPLRSAMGKLFRRNSTKSLLLSPY